MSCLIRADNYSKDAFWNTRWGPESAALGMKPKAHPKSDTGREYTASWLTMRTADRTDSKALVCAKKKCLMDRVITEICY